MSIQEPPEYTSEDFSVVNRYVDRMAQRHDAAIQHHRALTSEVYIRWAVIALAVGGVSAALIIWALGALNKHPDPIIVEPRVIQPPQVNVTIDGSQFRPTAVGSSAVNDARAAAGSRVESIIGSSTPQSVPATGTTIGPPAPEVINFVIFRELPFVRGKVNQVNIGMKYNKATDEKPTSQWCYVNAPNPSGSAVRVTLANKYENQRFDEELTTSIARELGMSLGDLNAAQRLCTFD